VPGRKTDVKDAEWIADLVRHGLVRASFVPPPAIRELRDLVRLRRSLSAGLTTERNRTLKLLETANVKLASVASEVFGVSGLAMLHALVENAATPDQMADLARGKLRRKLAPLARALEGRLTELHRFVLALHLRRMAAIEADRATLDARIEARMEPFQAQRALLRQIPGVDDRVAATIIAEIGIDMSVFGNAMWLASWAGVCPGNHESAGRRRGGRHPPGQRPPQDGPGDRRDRRVPAEGQLLQGQVPPAEGAAGLPAGRGRHRAQDPGRRLPHAGQRRSLPRPRRGVP
jgi:transposase